MANRTPEANRAYQAKWYRSHKALQLQRAKALKQRNVAYVWASKEAGHCANCSESDAICLDFHHEDPLQKDRGVAELARRGVSLQRLQAEIDKCILVCSNCHRKLHQDCSITVNASVL